MANENQQNPVVFVERIDDERGNLVPDGGTTDSKVLKLTGRAPATTPANTEVEVYADFNRIAMFKTQGGGYFSGSFNVQPGRHKFYVHIQMVGNSHAYLVYVT